MRTAEINRTTAETEITLYLNVDGTGSAKIESGCGFLDHMLTLFAKHGLFDLELRCAGDTQVDYHHSVEDIGICIGEAFRTALGDCKGILRYSSIALPMDEALCLAAVDVSGRGVLGYALDIPTEKVGDFDCELVREFFAAFTRESRITLHLRSLAGENSHHIIEGAFKGFAVALRRALETDPRRADQIPSTKGVL